VILGGAQRRHGSCRFHELVGIIRNDSVTGRAATPGAFAPGKILGRYELLAPIARGGMAEVWAARLQSCSTF